jgi:hypothetical protein
VQYIVLLFSTKKKLISVNFDRSSYYASSLCLFTTTTTTTTTTTIASSFRSYEEAIISSLNVLSFLVDTWTLYSNDDLGEFLAALVLHQACVVVLDLFQPLTMGTDRCLI